jgi:hypothetical protein
VNDGQVADISIESRRATGGFVVSGDVRPLMAHDHWSPRTGTPGPWAVGATRRSLSWGNQAFRTAAAM